MGVATYNWKYKSGSILPNGTVVPTTAEDVKPTGVMYIAIWGNDGTGNGSRQKPYKSLSMVTNYSGCIILASGVNRITSSLNFTGNFWIGDGNVIIDCFYSNLEYIFNGIDPAFIYRLHNINFKGNGNTKLSKGLYGEEYQYGIIENCTFDGVATSAKESPLTDTFILRSCIIKNVNRNIIVHFNIGSSVAFGSEINNSSNNTYINCRGLTISGEYYTTSNIFYNCNINFVNAVISFGTRYSLFFNCNFRLNATFLTGATFPTVPAGFTSYTNIDTLKSAILAYYPTSSSNLLNGCTIADPKFNNLSIGDFTLALDSPAKNLSYFGTYSGAKSIGLALKVRANAATSDFDNSTAVNLTIADDSLTLTSTASIGSIETKVKENPNGREFKALPTYGTNADRNGQYVDATSDLATTTISAGTAILANTPYLVEVGTITHNGENYTPGKRFNSGSITSFTSSVSGVVREILEAPARENVEARFSDGAGSTIDNTATLVVGSWYYVESGTATYNGTAYTAGTFIKVVTGITSFTGNGILRLVFSTSDTYGFYEINQLPTSNNTGNAQTGAIIRGNGDKDFDRTAANVFKISKRFFQMRYTIQVNNLTP